MVTVTLVVYTNYDCDREDDEDDDAYDISNLPRWSVNELYN